MKTGKKSKKTKTPESKRKKGRTSECNHKGRGMGLPGKGEGRNKEMSTMIVSEEQNVPSFLCTYTLLDAFNSTAISLPLIKHPQFPVIPLIYDKQK